MRWSGPYIVAIFFFISGYGLQYKYRRGQMDIEYLKNKTTRILLPIVFPLAIYVLLSCNSWESFKYKCEAAISHGNLILPYSWFVIVILFLYILYFLFVATSKVKCTFVSFIMFLVCTDNIFYRLGWGSSSFVSNIAFLLEIVYYENENVLLEYINNIGGGNYF